MWKCNICGAENEDNVKACCGCGAEIGGEHEVSGDETAETSNKKRNFIIGIVLAVILVAGVIALIMASMSRPDNSAASSYSELMESNPEINEKGVAFEVDGVKIKEEVWDYYFYAAAKSYANQNGGKYLDEIDWNKKDKNGQTPLDKVKYDAIKAVLCNAVMTSRAEEWGISLDDDDLNIIDVDLDYWKQVYGDDVYKELGMKDEKTYREIYKSILLENKVSNTVSEDIEKYSGGADLSKYADNKSAAVKCIEISKGEDGKSDAESAKTKIEEAKKRLDDGEKFDDVWLDVMGESYLAQTGQEAKKPNVISVYKGSVADAYKNIEKAALALKIGETSEIIETDYSYAVIKRVAGYTEIENMSVAESELCINKSIIESSKVK